MYSTGQTYQLKPGFYDQYKKAHDELWPELAQAMTAEEVNMVIFRYGDRLFLYATAPCKEHLERSHAGQRAQEWLEYMTTMMITGDDGKTIVEEMDMAFSFGAFKADDWRDT